MNSSATLVLSGDNQFGEHRGLGISVIKFKVASPDENGIHFLENAFHDKGGPTKHRHYDQHEGFHIVKDNFNLM